MQKGFLPRRLNMQAPRRDTKLLVSAESEVGFYKHRWLQPPLCLWKSFLFIKMRTVSLGQLLHTWLFEDFVVPFTCPVFCSQDVIEAHVMREWAEHSPSIICLKNQAHLHHNLKTNPRLLATTMKIAQLWCISFRLSPTPSQTPSLLTLYVTSISA